MIPVLVLHGPNLNMLGVREPGIYGGVTMDEINRRLVEAGIALGMEVSCRQSNHEGVLIDTLQEAMAQYKGIIFNPGGYTHTSVALRDAVVAIRIPVVEVHLSNIFAREPFRQHSMLSAVCAGTISGFGWRSYMLALEALAGILGEK